MKAALDAIAEGERRTVAQVAFLLLSDALEEREKKKGELAG